MSEHKFMRDQVSGALINTDADGLLRYKMKKKSAERIDKMEEEILEIKQLLISINSKLQGN